MLLNVCVCCVCVCVCVYVYAWVSGKSGQEGYVFCCDNLYCDFFLNPVCLFIIINLNAFDVALMCILHVVLN